MKKLFLLLSILLLGSLLALGQTRTVRGVVTSAEDGNPLPQLSVLIKGTSTGVVTDMDGKYTIKVGSPEAVLLFKYTGYDSQEITVGEQTEINVIMKPSLEEIDEVMVVAFGKSTKSAFTGSATAVNSKELERKQVSNVMNALSGLVPGVSIRSSNNQPGTSPTLKIRGTGSFSASSAPLYVVDGVPYDGDIAAINPADVESTTLLKDAASAALYGARGANGVVLITTKSGAGARGGDPCASRVNITASAKLGYNFRGVPEYDKITDPKQYIAKVYEAYANVGSGADFFEGESAFTYFPFTLPKGEKIFFRNADSTYSLNPKATVGRIVTDRDGTKYWLQPDDWTKEAFKPNLRQEYNISISGAANKVNYYFSSGYLNDKGYIVGSAFERFTTRLRADYRPKKWLNMGGTIAYTAYKSNMLADTESGGDSGNIFAMTDFAGPVYPVYLRDGNKNIMKDKYGNTLYDYGTGQYPIGKRNFLAISNPLSAYNLDTRVSDANIVAVKNYVDFLLPYNIKITFNVGYDLDNSLFTQQRNPFYGQFASSNGSIFKQHMKTLSYNLQQLATWNYTFDQVHNIDLLVGHEFYSYTSSIFYGSRKGLFDSKSLEINGAINDPKTGSYSNEYRTEGYLGRFMYNYDSRYFFSASYRRDGSSRFAKGSQWGNFWSVGASWLISHESFMEGTKDWLDMLKLKASYGVQGNDKIGDYRFADRYVLSNSDDHFAIGFSEKGNPNITWETSHNFNVGVEFEFLKRRLTGSVEFFYRTVYDMLFNRSVPNSAGYPSFVDNVGSMRNMGVDVMLKGIPYQDRNVVWSLYWNAGHVSNKLLKLPEEWAKVKGGYRSGISVYEEGKSMYARAYPHYEGLNEQGQALFAVYDPKKGVWTKSTDYQTALDKENRRIYKDIMPVLSGGFGTSVEFFGFDFSASFGYQLGGLIQDVTYQRLMYGGSSAALGRAMHKDLLKSWTPARKNTDVPRMSYNAHKEHASKDSDRFLISRNYLSIDNLTLGYTLPKKATDWLHISSLRVFAVADNVWIFSARRGLDPRFGSGVGYKVIRSISGGIRLTF